MVRETGFTSPLRLFSENPEEVLKRLRDGYIEYLGAYFGEADHRFRSMSTTGFSRCRPPISV